MWTCFCSRCEDLPPIEYDKDKKEDRDKNDRQEDPVYQSPIQDEPPSVSRSGNAEQTGQYSQQDDTASNDVSSAGSTDPPGNMGETVYGTEYTDPKEWYDDYVSKFSTDPSTQPHYHTEDKDLNPQPDDGAIYNDPRAYYPPPTSPEPILNEDGSKLENDVYYSRTYGTYMTYEGDKPVHFYQDSSLSVDSDGTEEASSSDGYTGGIATLNDVSGLVEYSGPDGTSDTEHYFVYDDKPDESYPTDGSYVAPNVEQTDSYVKTEAEGGQAAGVAPGVPYRPHYWPQHLGWNYPWWYGGHWWRPWWGHYVQYANHNASKVQEQEYGVTLNQYAAPESYSRTTREPQLSPHGTTYYGAYAEENQIPTERHSYQVQEDPGTSRSSEGVLTASGTIYYGSTGQLTSIPTQRHSYEVDLSLPPSYEPGIHDTSPQKSHYTPAKKSHPPPPKKSHPPPPKKSHPPPPKKSHPPPPKKSHPPAPKKSHPPPPKKSHYQPPAKSHPPPKSHPPAPKKSHPPPPKKSHYEPPQKSHPPPKKSHEPPPKSHPPQKSHPPPQKSHPPPKSFPHPKKSPPHPKKAPPKKNGEDSGYTPTVRQEGLSYSLGDNLHVRGNTLIHTDNARQGGQSTNYIVVSNLKSYCSERAIVRSIFT